jgi:glycosyltransferase involved in cell wall biosynthesis
LTAPLKIACISTSRVPSDTANSIQVMKACQGLVRSGHHVHLLLPGSASTAWDLLSQQYGLSSPFEISWLPANPALKRNDFAWQAVRRARQVKADMLYTWTGQSAVFGLARHMPVAYELHDLPTGRLGPLWFRLFLGLPGRKRLLPITQALQRKLEQVYPPAAAEQMVISPNGVDLEQYEQLPSAAEARAAVGLPQAVTVLCSGHLYAGRGVDLFVNLARRFPQANFVWVGGRPEDVEAYRAAAAADGLGNVLFTGFVNQPRLPAYQAAADILLMPYARAVAGSSGGNSADICSPMKMFDYLAAGRAILSSDLPVIHEVLNNSNAVFAPPEDLDGWAAALQRLLSDAVSRSRLAEQARCDAQYYTWTARAEKALAGFPRK